MPMTAGVVGAQVLGGAIGGKASKKAAKSAAAAQAAAQAQMMARLNSIQDPALRQVIMDQPELVGLLDAEQLGKSGMEDISVDPRLREAQMQALEQLRERGETGFSAEDKAQLGQMRREEDARAQSSQKQILADAAQSGTLDSGMSLAAKLAAQQGAAQRGMQGAEQMAAQGSAARRDALAQAGQLGGQMASQQFGEQAQQAQARDVIARFNAQNRQSVNATNLGARQNLSDQQRNTNFQNQNLANQHQMDKFNVAMNKATGQNAISAQQGQTQANLQSQLGQGAANMWSGLGNAVAGGISAVGARDEAAKNRAHQIELAKTK